MARPQRTTPWSDKVDQAPHDRYIAVWGKTDTTKPRGSEFVAMWNDHYNQFVSKTGWVVVSVEKWALIA